MGIILAAVTGRRLSSLRVALIQMVERSTARKGDASCAGSSPARHPPKPLTTVKYMMDLFHTIEDGNAIVCSRGIFRQVKVFRKGEDVYAGCGTGFVKLYSASGTSSPKINWWGVEGVGIVQEAGKAPKWIDDTLKITPSDDGGQSYTSDGYRYKNKSLKEAILDGNTVRKPRSAKKHT